MPDVELGSHNTEGRLLALATIKVGDSLDEGDKSSVLPLGAVRCGYVQPLPYRRKHPSSVNIGGWGEGDWGGHSSRIY